MVRNAQLLSLKGTPEEQRRWSDIFDTSPPPSYFSPYRVSSEDVYMRALFSPPAIVGSRVTDFSSWVWSLYCSDSEKANRQMGTALQPEIAAIRKEVGSPKKLGWNVVHQDIQYPTSSAKCSSILERLAGKKSFLGSPDVVLREKATGRVIILEIKTTNAVIPSDGWPDLRAQLWAYSMLDEWRDAPDMLLVGEIWSRRLPPRRLHVLKWSKADLMDENKRLFEIYCGLLRRYPSGVVYRVGQ